MVPTEFKVGGGRPPCSYAHDKSTKRTKTSLFLHGLKWALIHLLVLTKAVKGTTNHEHMYFRISFIGEKTLRFAETANPNEKKKRK